MCDGDWTVEHDDFSLQRFHGQYLLIVFIELDMVDASKQFLQVRLDDQWIRGLTKDFQQVIISNEIEARKQGAFLLLYLKI